MKRKVALLLALVLACSMFAGCKQDPANTTTGEPAPSTTAGNQEEPTTPAAEPAGPVELNVVTTYAGEDTNAGNFQDAVKAWEAATGNTVIDGSATSNEQFKAQLRADFEMGAEPDVLFFFNGVDSNSFIDKVVSIDEIRAEYPEYATNMKDGMMGASPVDGKNYSVPVNGYWEGLFVNKTVLAAAGVDVPGADYTWDQFMTDCAKIKEAGYVPVAASLKEIPHYWFEFTIYNHLTPATHNILPGSVDDEHGKAWVAGIGDIKSMYEAGCFPANTLTATDAETFRLFIEDKAAFLIDGSWKTGGIESAFADADGKVDPEKIANFTVTYVPGMNNRKASDIIGGLSNRLLHHQEGLGRSC